MTQSEAWDIYVAAYQTRMADWQTEEQAKERTTAVIERALASARAEGRREGMNETDREELQQSYFKQGFEAGKREGIEEAAKVAESAIYNEYGRPQPVLVARLRALAEKRP